MHNESEVARLRTKIEQECQAMKAGLDGYAAVGSHDTINHKYETLGDYQGQLEELVGSKEAAQITIDVYQGIME